MFLSRQVALAAVKPMCRTLASAPDPRARARAIFAELTRADDWSAEEERLIAEFGRWLSDHPPLTGLRPRCQDLLSNLAAEAR